MLDQLQPLARLAEQSLTSIPAARDPYRDHRVLMLALFAYRQGDFTNAVIRGRQTLKYPNPAVLTIAHCLLAMSHHQLGEHDTAQARTGWPRNPWPPILPVRQKGAVYLTATGSTGRPPASYARSRCPD